MNTLDTAFKKSYKYCRVCEEKRKFCTTPIRTNGGEWKPHTYCIFCLHPEDRDKRHEENDNSPSCYTFIDGDLRKVTEPYLSKDLCPDKSYRGRCDCGSEVLGITHSHWCSSLKGA